MDEENKTVDESPTDAVTEVETAPPKWKHLAPKTGSWRRQYYVKERNMTVGQLVSTIRANKYTLEMAGENLELPLEVLQEAVLYYEQNKELIQHEAGVERQALAAKGFKQKAQWLNKNAGLFISAHAKS